MNENLITVFVAFTVAREIYFTYTTNKLLNKLMSRNYYDYTTTNKVGSTEPNAKKLHIPADGYDETGALQDIG